MLTGGRKKFIKELAAKAKARRESGLFIVDGPKMCSELPGRLAEEIYVTGDFMSSGGAGACKALLENNPYTVIGESDMRQISDTVTPQGILCIARQPDCGGTEKMIGMAGGKPHLLIILENIQDPGNLGTIFRAGEAAGVTGIIINGASADIYSPKAARSTMGSLFRVPFSVVGDAAREAELLKSGAYTGGKSIDILAAELSGDREYTEFDYRKPCAFMIGNESKGLSPNLIRKATVRIRIPMQGSVESLNAAMAAAVIGFEAARQRRS